MLRVCPNMKYYQGNKSLAASLDDIPDEHLFENETDNSAVVAETNIDCSHNSVDDASDDLIINFYGKIEVLLQENLQLKKELVKAKKSLSEKTHENTFFCEDHTRIFFP